MGQYETIRGNVADVYVVNDDIAGSAQITADKLAATAGGFAAGTFVSGNTTWTGTAAFTVFNPVIVVTAAGADSFVTMGTTAVATAIMACTATAAGSYSGGANGTAFWTNLNAVTAANTKTVEISAGGSVSISAINSVAGKYFFQWIATPS